MIISILALLLGIGNLIFNLKLNNKIKDLDILIQYFEERERYEDCALLLEVKRKVEKKELLLKIQGNE